jgi:hypothetical protein
MATLGKALVLLGLVAIVLGLVLQVVPSVGFVGRLPGDIYIKRGNFSFYFPLTTCVLLSIVLTLLVALLRR